MSIPCLHSPSVWAIVPSPSMIASSKNSEGCRAQTRSRDPLMVSVEGFELYVLRGLERTMGFR